MKNRFLLIMLLVVALDQASKLLIRTFFSLGQTFTLIPGFFSITYITNTGASFGMLKGYNIGFILLSLAVLGILLWNYRKDNKDTVPIAIICGGIMGNLVDRVVLGFVVDFIHFHFWPVFNIADSAISMGVVLLLLGTLKNNKKIKTR